MEKLIINIHIFFQIIEKECLPAFVFMKLKWMQTSDPYGVKEKKYRPILSMNIYKNKMKHKNLYLQKYLLI